MLGIELSLIIVTVTVALYYGSAVVYARLLRRRLARMTHGSGKIVLTFDDGPGNRLTPAILNVLRDRGCHATFFVLGRSISGREDLLRRIHAEGHEIGSHGYDHLHYWRVLPWTAIRDIARGWEAIDTVLGRSGGTYPFRPPYGKLNALAILYLWVKGVSICYWTADTTDTWPRENRNGAYAINRTRQAEGAVLLAHDFDRTSAEVDSLVMECLDAALNIAERQKWSVLTFSDLANGRKGAGPAPIQDSVRTQHTTGREKASHVVTAVRTKYAPSQTDVETSRE